ncbi:hypothetical protein PybrP1_005293, partial [[Pythium] brassicae (nom. inval.)]
MGNVASWIAQCIYPEDQVLWQAARSGDAHGLHNALAKLTPETRKHVEWQEPCSGRTALAEAALRGNRACVAALVQHGANCNVKDYRGNTPLHLACKKGRDDVVQFLLQVPSVFPFETNLDALTPLDLVRNRIKDADDDYPLSFERCLEELEKKFCIYSGWLYEQQDNVLSMVSGMASLTSWKRRFCIVLERGASDILELALFAMKPCGMRPVCPKSVVLYQVGAGMTGTTDSKWFNRKDFVFTIQGSQKDKGQYDATVTMQPLAFAAVDQHGYDAWQRFFAQQQQSLHSRTTELYGPPVVALCPPQPSQAAAAAVGLPYPQLQFPPAAHDRSESKAAFALPPPPPAVLTADAAALREQEEEDVRRAIWLSLQTTNGGGGENEQLASSPPLPVSAPDWDEAGEATDEDSQHSASSRGSAAGGAAPANRQASSPPVVNFGRAPSYSGIGECVICFDGPQAAVCVPCGHNAICMACAEEILDTTCECPVCRHPIRELIKLYR